MKKLNAKEMEVIEKIYELNIHKAITVKAIQQLSFKGSKSAWDIRNSGYTDPITEELYQNTLLELLEVVNNGICTLDNDKLVFIDTDENGNSDTFLNIFRSIRRYLDSKRQEEKKWLYIQDFNDDKDSQEYGEVIATYSINDKKALSERSNIDTINEMEVIKTVRSALKEKDKVILDDLLNGLSYRDIATKNNMTKKAVECAVNRIRKAYPKEEIKRLSEVQANWKDNTKHTYFDFNNTEEHTLSDSMKEVYNRYIIIHNDFMDKAKDTTEVHTVIEEKQVVYPFTPSNATITSFPKASTKYIAKHTTTGQGDGFYKIPLLADKLTSESKQVEKPKATIKKRKKVK